MLGNLFGSNARVKILKIFLLNPENKYYIRQLARDLSLQVNSVRRELENLEKFGLLNSHMATSVPDDGREEQEELKKLFQGKVVESRPAKKSETGKSQEKKYYQANKNFVLFEEIKALIIKAQILYEKDFLEKLKKIGCPKLIVLTGFFVNDDSSPVDILVVGRLNKEKIMKVIGELEKEVGRELNFTLMSNNEFKYRKDITDIFLYGILEGKNIVIIDESESI